MNVAQRGEKLDLNLHDDGACLRCGNHHNTQACSPSYRMPSDEKYELLLGDVGSSHSMIWLVVGLAWLLKAGEDFNKSIVFVPSKYVRYVRQLLAHLVFTSTHPLSPASGTKAAS